MCGEVEGAGVGDQTPLGKMVVNQDKQVNAPCESLRGRTTAPFPKGFDLGNNFIYLFFHGIFHEFNILSNHLGKH